MTQEQLASLQYMDLREELLEMVTKDLLGPAGGPEEIVDESNVRGRYILGLLAPRGQSALPEEQDNLAVDGTTGDNQDGKPAARLPHATSMLPSSIGMTFSVALNTPALEITARWGQYHRTLSETLKTASGDPKLIWQREPIESTSEPIPLEPGFLDPWYPDPGNQEVYVRGLVRKRTNAWTITLYLINAQSEPKVNKDGAWVFQPELIVREPDGKPVFIKRQVPPELNIRDPEDRAMEMLYRRVLEFAVGHGVGVTVTPDHEDWTRAVEIRTETLPGYEVERMEAPTSEDLPKLGNVLLDMQALSEVEMGKFSDALHPLVEAYEDWLAEQQDRINNPPPDLESYLPDGQANFISARETLERIREGIALLDTDENAADAFKFTNRAMALQRIRSIYARLVRQGEKPDLEEINIPKNRSWRPFQLAFVLLNLAGLLDPRHPDRSEPTTAKADLLWFPTGGGKTEAYLGVAAFAMGIRRLQGELGGLSGHAGITVLMRYTLRLLTLQQFQRATALICACEIIRCEDPGKWGPEPFRIGLWVGQRSTPNWTKDAAEIIKQDRNIYVGSGIGGKGTPAQLTNCPWCGRPINPGKDIKVETYSTGRGRTFQYCSDEYGECPFSYRKSPDEGLPILVVDEEIYRRLPSLLIATVDKFAQMPWKGETQTLFGRVNGYCQRHGYRSPEIEDVDSHRKRGFLPAAKTQPMGHLRPPDLIIQDELHLISGPLGTLVGLYETTIDQLSSWKLDGQRVYPKVIASTATIRRAREQVYSLFQREVKIFPPSGLDVTDNFFSRRVASTEETPGRKYIGICAPGTRLKTVLIRVYAAFMSASQVLYEKYERKADPWMTLVGYFNSMRELGGMRRVVDDTLRTRLQNMDDRGLAKRFISPWNVEESTSRRSAAEIPKVLDRLEAIFDPVLEKDRKENRKAGKRVEGTKYPLDVVLATNMISVGVDVSRLGLMVVANQPKATAEYIQATSRVGREFPGVVCTVYNWARPRDLSHYERFEHYHATFYQQVEALSVTPFSPRALDRGLSAVLVSYLRLFGDEFNPNDHAGEITANHPFVQYALRDIGQRAGLVSGENAVETFVRQSVQSRIDEWISTAQNTGAPAILGYAHKKGGLTVPLLSKPEDDDWGTFTCLSPLRDVEPGVALVLNDYGMDREPRDIGNSEEGEDG